MAMTLETLQTELEMYPERYAKALERQTKANGMLEQANEELKNAMFEQDEDEDIIESPLSVKLEKERLRFDQKRAKTEIEYRRNPQGDKITEATVSAFIKANDELCSLKEKLIDMEYQVREERNTLRSRFKPDPKPSKAAIKLADKVEGAENEKMIADVEVAKLEAQLETYRMLTGILLTTKELQETQISKSSNLP